MNMNSNNTKEIVHGCMLGKTKEACGAGNNNCSKCGWYMAEKIAREKQFKRIGLVRCADGLYRTARPKGENEDG